MEYVLAKNTEEDFQGFLKLEEEFDRHYVNLGIGEQYVRIPFEEQEQISREEFADYFKNEGYFLLAKEGSEYIGYIAGGIQEMPRGYAMRKVGYLDSIIVAEKYRGQGISKQMRDLFFEWLKSKDITICQLHVKTKNTEVIDMYEKWGFEPDELRLWKKI